jgi:hypothetical protein
MHSVSCLIPASNTHIRFELGRVKRKKKKEEEEDTDTSQRQLAVLVIPCGSNPYHYES